MEDVMIDFPVSPTLLRVVRVFRIGRILRLIKVRQKSLNNKRAFYYYRNYTLKIKNCPTRL